MVIGATVAARLLPLFMKQLFVLSGVSCNSIIESAGLPTE